MLPPCWCRASIVDPTSFRETVYQKERDNGVRWSGFAVLESACLTIFDVNKECTGQKKCPTFGIWPR